MFALTKSIQQRFHWAGQKFRWIHPQWWRLIVRLLFSGAVGGLTIALFHKMFKGMCRTPWEAMHLMVHLLATVGSTVVNFVARGCKPKFRHWTLRFEILRALIRECTRGTRGTRMVTDVKYASVIRSQSAVCGTLMGWWACRQSNRRLEAVQFNHLEHLWLRSPVPQSFQTKRLVVFYIHGGGFALFSPRLYVSFGVTLAVAIEQEVRQQVQTPESVIIDVFLSNYRKAPEHCFPAPAEDTVSAYMHVLHTEGLSPDQIILMGDSAGGGLVMSTLLRVRERNRALLPLAAILLCPAVDLSGSETQVDEKPLSPHCLLSPELVAAGRLAYHVTAFDPRTWADASSVHCDLRGLPPVFIQAASLDYIYQHSILLARKAAADGVTDWELDVHKDMPHVFSIFPSHVLPYAQIGLRRVATFAGKHFVKGLTRAQKESASQRVPATSA